MSHESSSYRPTSAAKRRPLLLLSIDGTDGRTDGMKKQINITNDYYYYYYYHIRLRFIGLFSRTTWVSWYQIGKTSLDLNQARDDGVCMGMQWHQLDDMETICTSPKTE